MKYLIIGKQAFTPLPPAQLVTLNQAAKAWVKERMADGSLECQYVFPDGGGFVIANVPSHEAVLDLLLGYPLYPLMTWEIKALCDWEYSYNQFIEYWPKLVG